MDRSETAFERLSRRQALRRIGAVAGGVALAPILAACGSPDEEVPPTVTRNPEVATPAAPTAAPTEAPASPTAESGGASPTAETGGETPTPSEVTITSLDIRFEPTEVTIPAGAPVTLILPNAGAAPHNFSIDALGISIDQLPGETKEAEINAAPGEYEYYCNVPGHREAGMIGKLIVTTGGATDDQPAATPGASPAASPTGVGGALEGGAEPVTIISLDIRFEPTEVTIPANTPVTFMLPNEGAAPHNFSIDALAVSIDQLSGETKETEITAAAGEYEYYCNVPGHREAGMVGKLIVT